MRGRATADEHGVDARLMQSPRQREKGLRVAGTLRDGFEPRKALIRRVMKIDVLMPRNDFEA